eukprot:m.66453 g.66453  ORF g.66453 m.66453 type:complete len:160 (-) comp9818_c0_seq1:160-639(-)
MPWWLIALVICTLLLILHRFYGASSPLQPFIPSLLRVLSLEGNTDADGACLTTLTLPRDVTPYKRLPAEGEFTPETMPRGLLDQHNTKAGVWGKICVAQGELHLRILEGSHEEVTLRAGEYGVVAPKEMHQVEPLTDDMRMHVVFHAVGGEAGRGGGFG